MFNARKVRIIATDQDGLNTKNYIFEFLADNQKLNDTIAVKQAIKDAVKEFCQTEEGRKVYEGNCNSFNWGDLDAYVPETVLNKYGLYKPDAVSRDILEVDFNEQLIEEDAVLESDTGQTAMFVAIMIRESYVWVGYGETEEKAKKMIADKFSQKAGETSVEELERDYGFSIMRCGKDMGIMQSFDGVCR